MTKRQKILLGILTGVLVLMLAVECVIAWAPGLWHPIDFFPSYHGMLDTPITEITIRRGLEEITFSDEDLIRQWEEGLKKLELKKEEVQWHKIFPVSMSGTNNEITLRTETGEYILVTTFSVPETKVYLGVFGYAANNPDYLPIESTFDQAARRHGETGPGEE